MVEFIIGKASSGKTYETYNRIKEKLKKGDDEIILLVPEQFTFESEKALLNLCGAKSSMVNVFSFTKLCNSILNDFGGKKAKILDDVSKNIFIGKALSQVKDNLKVFNKCEINSDICNSLSALITEFSQADLTSEKIRNAYNKTEDGLSLKMNDFALIMDAYNSLISNGLMDPDTLINLAYEKIVDKKWFKNKTVFIDSFTGFTAVQAKLVELIIKEADKAIFSFCIDNFDIAEDYNVFCNIKEEAVWVRDIAKKYDVPTTFVCLENNKRSAALINLECILNGSEVETFTQDADNIVVCQAKDDYGEIDFVANEISLLVKNGGYRYKDFAVIAANADDYISIVNNIFPKYNIPFYSDNRVTADTLPLMMLFLSVAQLLVKFNTESVLNLLKTGLTNIEDDELNLLEDYVYVWDINGKSWFDEWTMNPDGFDESFDKQGAENQLSEVNRIREKVILPFFKLKSSFDGSVKKKILAIYNFLIELEVPSRLKKYADELKNDGNIESSELQKASWDCLIKIINRIIDCCSDDYLTNKEFYDLLLLNINSETLGTVPQHTDEIIFGSADRIRTGFIKVAFLIGVNQSVFPAFNRPCGLLSPFERADLREKKIKIPDRDLSDIIENEYRFYNCACTPSDKVYFSYTTQGNESQPSSILNYLIENMPRISFIKADNGENLDLNRLTASTPAFEKLIKNYSNTKNVDLKYYFENNENFAQKLKAIDGISELPNLKIDSKIAEKLYGDILYSSASKIDTFHRCSFSYFCRYGLKIDSLKKAEISSMIRGTVAHFVLEKAIKKHKDTIREVTNEQLEIDVDFYSNQYFKNLNIDIELLSEEFKDTLNSIKTLTLGLLLQIRNEFITSKFEIEACELEISNKADIKPLKVYCDNGKTVSLSGKIDRVDILVTEQGKYVRVVDYKTNAKSFEFSDVLFGQNLQMLIYLYCVIKNGKSAFGDLSPAGVLYLPVKDTFDEEETHKMNGLLIKNTDVINDMSNTPETYLPVGFVKSGDFSKRSKVITESDFKKVFDFIDKKISKMGNSILNGEIGVNPVDGCKGAACKYCEFASVCRVDILDNIKKAEFKSNDDVLFEMEGVSNFGN